MPEAASFRCPRCERAVRAGTRFCPECGLPFANAPATVAAPPADGIASSARFETQWHELKVVGWIFGLLLATSVIFAFFAGRGSPWPEVIAGGIDALIAVVAAALRFPKLRFLFHVHAATVRDVLALLGTGIAFVAAMAGYFWALRHLGVPFASASNAFVKAGWPTWSILLCGSVMPAVFEELAFRGVIQSSLERVLNARDAWLIQAALFSVLHISPIIFPSHFVMGLCFGYLRRRSRSIYPGMFLHGAWNAFVILGELG